MTQSTQYFLDNLELNSKDVIAIDGPCGSGKTTLANQIKERFDVDIIHMDDFFLPMDLRTPDRLKECGGNVHYERFFHEVISGIRSNTSFSYGQFSCKTMKIENMLHISNIKPIIIEGSYSLRPDFASIYTKRIYLTIDSNLQLQRLLNRVGPERLNDFENLWIPKEQAYFQHYNIKACADIILSNS